MADTDYRNWRRRVYEPAARKVGIDVMGGHTICAIPSHRY